ncbi:MAG TPA: hypothetical protein VFE47_09170 [Tepidisphaeraceae bacterium]|nr:hypothetical protein [Tepidisphaeraceae bacterium]
MKHFSRWIIFAATLISFLILLALVALCRHSKSRIDEAHYLSADGGLYSLRIHSFQVQLSWLADAPKKYEDDPVAAQPRRGWSAASYVPGVAEVFKNDHLPGLLPSDNISDPDLDMGTTTIVHEWVLPDNLVHGFGWRETRKNGSIAVDFQQLCFPAWVVFALFALLPSMFLTVIALRAPPVRRWWIASLPRRGMRRLKSAAASALSRTLSPLHALGETSAGSFVARALHWGYASIMVGLLLLGVAAAAVWLRSHWCDDWISRSADQTSTFAMSFDSHHGRFAIWRRCMRGGDPRPMHWTLDANGYQGQDPFIFWDWNTGIGGCNTLTSVSWATRSRAVMLPDWAIVFLLMAPPIAWFAGTSRRRIRRRQRAGLCPACGFDLRASPLRCPECGLLRDARFSPGIGAAHHISFAAMTLLLGIIIAAAWWSNPLRGATPGPGANPDAGILFDPIWQAPHGLEDTRMLHQDATWGLTWYQSIWHHAERPQDDRLVLVDDMGVSLFNEYWRVVVLDRSFRVIREGQIPLPQQSTPYRLVEIRSDRADLPAEYRGKWVLAVESVCPAKFREDPLKISPANLDRAIVEWDKTAHIQSADWRDTPGLAVRPAEPGAAR